MSQVKFYEVTEPKRQDLGEDHYGPLEDTKVLKIEKWTAGEFGGIASAHVADATDADKLAFPAEFKKFETQGSEAEFESFVNSKRYELKAEFEAKKASPIKKETKVIGDK